jgi:molecular chaperone GrpE
LSDEDPAGGPKNPNEGGEKAPGASEPAQAQSEAAPTEATGLADVLEVPDSDAVEAFHRRARLAEDRLAEVLSAYRTLRTENEGYRDRITKNLERRFDQRRERLLLKFIDILDNLDRALEAAEQSYAGEPLIEGLILVRTQLLQTLQEEGLERIPVLGLPYDPNFSEAVEMRAVDDPDYNNVVVKELLRGYRLNGRIARASRVVVGHYEGEDFVSSLGPDEATDPACEPSATPPVPPEQAGSTTKPVAGSHERPSGAAEPSLEDIISRAEAQEALSPDARDEEEGDKKPK